VLEALEVMGAPWPTICASCWDDISREGAHACCDSFRCARCHTLHQAEDEQLMAMLVGLDD
jgi:hypothetical protein